MKKSLLALAVLGALASAAQAQTSVTLYGIVDGGLLYRSGLPDNVGTGNASAWSFGSGIEATNRWGIRGEEALGGGLSATFALENGFASGTGGFLGSGGTTAISGKLFDRGATVGLKGSFGSLTMGRNWSPFVLSQIAIDSNGFSNFGSLNSLAFQVYPVYNTAFLTGNGVAAATAASLAATGLQAGLGTGFTYYWVDNSFVYTTPNFSGFQGSLMVGLGGIAGDNSSGRTLSASGTYANGPLAVAIGYYDSKLNGTTGNNLNGYFGSLATFAGFPAATVATLTLPNTESGQRAWHLGGKYNFGPVTASLEYANYKSPLLSQLVNVDFWDLGASIPVGPNGVVYLNYLRKRDKNFSPFNGSLYKIAYDHNFSKTTTAYVNLGFTRNDSFGTLGAQNSGYTQGGANQTALGVGMRKAF